MATSYDERIGGPVECPDRDWELMSEYDIPGEDFTVQKYVRPQNTRDDCFGTEAIVKFSSEDFSDDSVTAERIDSSPSIDNRIGDVLMEYCKVRD